MDKGYKFLWIFVFIVFLAGSAFGGFNYFNNNLIANYSGGEKIKGSVNISFDDSPAGGLLTSNFEGEISLKDFFNVNTMTLGEDYECNTPDCENGYASEGQASGLGIQGDEKIVGFKVSGQDVQITSAEFRITSNAVSSCENQIFIDILDDGEDYFLNNKKDVNNVSCGISYTSGCFNPSASSEVEIYSDRKYCEKISLPPAPAYIVGAKVRNITGGESSDLIMSLYNSGENLGSCILPEHSQNLEELKCVIDYSGFETEDYFVCIKSEDDSGYKIRRETQEPKCGSVVLSGDFSNLNNDFEIFAETIKYGGNPSITINDGVYESKFFISLVNLFDDYLSAKYGRNCEDFECFFPIRLGGNNQFLQFLNISIGFEESGVPNTLESFDKFVLEEPLISSDVLELDLEKAGFMIPIVTNEDKFKLYLDGNLVFDKGVNIQNGFAFDINQRIVPFGQNTLFSIISGENISNSTWDFGDGSPVKRVQGGNESHLYISQNRSFFDLFVTAVSDKNMKATKTFRIFVGNPKELSNETIKSYEKRILNITGAIEEYPDWISKKLEELINLQNLNSSLSEIKKDFVASVTEEDYKKVMISLINLKIPYELKKSVINAPLTITFDGMNVDYIEKISNKDIEDNNDLKEKILGWMDSGFNAKISYESITGFYDTKSEVLLSKFKIETNPDSPRYDNYLIFGQNVDSSGKFKESYGEKRITGSEINYVILNTEKNEVFEFFITGLLEPENLGAYISPEVSRLPVSLDIEGECNLNNICEVDENSVSCPEDCSNKWFKFTLIGWILLIFFALVIYIFLQEWYKKHYQKRLFPEENDLYNLVNFIYNARKSRLSDELIKDRLEKEGWAGEKVSYAFKKIEGKRLGMLEIPVLKFLEKKKVQKEIAMRQQGRTFDSNIMRRRF
ncbi:MAG: hypothetical protein Q8P57_04620 [Candidatus Pacearchaeota archaeon]|nr:hypothetical protein [Candidatus Pacearchaeota archaeon]